MDESVDFIQGQQENPAAQALWAFALSRYQRPGVAEACLALQDEAGVDVLLLLAAAYLAECGVALDAARVAALQRCTGSLREELIAPLRALRRRYRDGDDNADRQRLYASLKEAELAAERWQISRLAQALSDWLPTGRHGAATVAGNVQALVGDLDSAQQAHLTALLARLD